MTGHPHMSCNLDHMTTAVRGRSLRWPLAWLWGALLACGVGGPCQAGMARYCDAPLEPSVAQKDQLLRFAGAIKAALDDSGHRLAIVARSGLDLARFGQRYSHAGISLKASSNAPWSVRQLYYACDERVPRIFDQGVSGFVFGTDDPRIGYVSVVLVPPERAAALEQAVLDDRQALRLLGTVYSANAHPFSLRYQNCNQWVAEMLATAWGPAARDGDWRANAQSWLQEQGYVPTVFDVGWRPLMWLSTLSPWLHADDHPPADIEQKVFRVSMPASIEAFLRGREPRAERIEFCHADRRIVIRRGWEPIADGCLPGEQDTVITLD